MTAKERRRYLSYLLRLWQASGDEEEVWRASLESPHTGEREGFANLKSLFVFLEEQVRGHTTHEEQSKGASQPEDQ